MGEFIFNRGRSQTAHSYLDTGGRGAAATALARNFAKGPGSELAQAITTTGTQVNWGTIDEPGTSPSAEDVPITPRVSGIITVKGVLSIQNGTADPATVTVQVQVDDSTVSTPAPEVTVPPTNSGEETNGFAAVPFLVEITGLVLGTTVKIQVLATALTDSALSLTVNDSTVEVQEVFPATG